ncbi:MAG TPA: alpha/beta hydrolase-fold protein [Flavitalea sp.]|nr:alpha/beta hydrolase-fold protein [Flavitalea sp.]
MQVEISKGLAVERVELRSEPLERTVLIDFYLPLHIQPEELNLLLINDGQDLVTMGFEKLMDHLLGEKKIQPLLCVGIHCGEDRKHEYGLAAAPDFKGRGAKAALYQRFIIDELLPFISEKYNVDSFRERAFAGFSLGALSALDIVWNHPHLFTRVGTFSGSLWWRSKDKSDKDYDESSDRLMHQQIRNGQFHPSLNFFFQCGTMDEGEDRNRNGVIDSIDDTIDLMKELLQKGYREGKEMIYYQIPGGRHDVATWAHALPTFLQWGWGRTSS